MKTQDQIMSRYKAVIFDLDGTLLDTLADLGNSVNRVLEKNGLPGHALEAYKYFVGDGARTLISRALPADRRDEATIKEFLQLFFADYGSNWAVDTRPYPGVEKMLTGIEKRNIPVAVLSNKPDDFTRLCVEKFLSGHQFSHVFGQRDPLPRKPDPRGALEISRLLGREPASFLYLGDTAIDMKTAVAAGMYPVGACWGFRPEQELVENGALTLIHHPAALLDLFQD